ncbi:MAG: hypothetical protein JXA18_03805 [Chitinispirillaceae bacterium]|nr:hypothetical protein [Chitinispirillaceae bacterium]
MALRHSLPLFGAWLLTLYFGCSELREDHPQAVVERCEVCHDMPPNDSGIGMETHFNHVIDSNMGRNLKCWQCHLNCDLVIQIANNPLDSTATAKYDTVMVWALDSLHRDNASELDSNDYQCRLCHDYQECDECHQSPPNNISFPISQRVHKVHVTQQGFGCDTCHSGYDPANKKLPITFNRVGIRNVPSTLHDNGDTNVIFDVKKKPGHPVEPTYDPVGKTCNNLYCHGAMTWGGKPSVAIPDLMPQDSNQCSFCHNIDSLRAIGPNHRLEAHAPLFPDCLNCHPGFRLNTRATDEAKHRNGVLDIISRAKCDSCHTTPIFVVP